MKEVEKIRIRMDTVRQVIYIVRRCRSVDEVLEKLQIMLAELEMLYDAELLEDPVLYTALQVVDNAGR